MAITSAEIHNQSFSIDRKGYDVDEVDVFLEHVAEEIDAMNAQIEQLQRQADESSFSGFDTPARIDDSDATKALQTSDPEKDERIAELERQLEARKADDNAIAQALIIAQRSADEIISAANSQASGTIQDAEGEAQRIVDKAEADRQKVYAAIKKLEDDREDAREEYQELLTDFITDATRKLAEIGGDITVSAPVSSAHARSVSSESFSSDRVITSSAQVPINKDGKGAYSMPQTNPVAVSPATPTPSRVEKDLSGFGDADDSFEFEEVD